ncbi:MAG: MarR family transcriptional regulator [Bryobacterales bacterium]|nr:MarR family transcriptional regulator [Bryobacterales bacterium]
MNLSLHDYRELAAFRHLLRLFLHFSESQAREHGLEPQQHQALLALKGIPEGRRPTIGDLAERLLLRHHTTVELVNRLESAGLVQRRPGTEDRREILLHLTAKGSRKLASLSVAHQEELRIKGPELAHVLGSFLSQSTPPEVL